MGAGTKLQRSTGAYSCLEFALAMFGDCTSGTLFVVVGGFVDFSVAFVGGGLDGYFFRL